MKHFILIVLIFTFISCAKSPDDHSLPDKTKPTLTIIAPAKSETYHTGDPLCFKGDVIDNNSLSNVKLKFFKADNMETAVIEYSYPVNERSLYVEQKTIIPAALNGNCVMQFEATDFSGNRSVVTLNFSGN